MFNRCQTSSQHVYYFVDNWVCSQFRVFPTMHLSKNQVPHHTHMDPQAPTLLLFPILCNMIMKPIMHTHTHMKQHADRLGPTKTLMDPHTPTWTHMEGHGRSQNVTECHGTWRNMAESDRTWWNIVESPGTLRNVPEPYGILCNIYSLWPF